MGTSFWWQRYTVIQHMAVPFYGTSLLAWYKIDSRQIPIIFQGVGATVLRRAAHPSLFSRVPFLHFQQQVENVLLVWNRLRCVDVALSKKQIWHTLQSFHFARHRSPFLENNKLFLEQPVLSILLIFVWTVSTLRQLFGTYSIASFFPIHTDKPPNLSSLHQFRFVFIRNLASKPYILTLQRICFVPLLKLATPESMFQRRITGHVTLPSSTHGAWINALICVFPLPRHKRQLLPQRNGNRKCFAYPPRRDLLHRLYVVLWPVSAWLFPTRHMTK